MQMPNELKDYATRIGFGDSETMAEILTLLFDDENKLKLAAALPGTIEELSEKTGMSEDEVKALADKLTRQGIINHVIRKGDYYRLFPAMIELRDSSVIVPEFPKRVIELWEKLVKEEMPRFIPILKELKAPPMLRVVPIEETVQSKSQVLDADSARKIFEDATLITAIPCPCRTIAKAVGKGKDCPAPESAVCMQTNGFAEAVLNRRIGEELTNEEALKRIGEAEEAGLVHMVRNNIKDDMLMCNCCSCCCTGLFILNELGYKDAYSPSRFQVEFDAELCSGCGECEDRCQFNAIEVDEIANFDLEKCYGCGLCVQTCPSDAITLKEIRPLEFIRKT